MFRSRFWLLLFLGLLIGTFLYADGFDSMAVYSRINQIMNRIRRLEQRVSDLEKVKPH